MRSIKAKLWKSTGSPTTPNNKDDWTKSDQRVWHSVAVNHPAKLSAKLSKHENVNVNKLCPSVGYSVVHYAAAKGLDDCLNVLLAHNANVSTRDVTGATPLHASARYGHKGTTAKLLSSLTVNVNARDTNNCTALHFCAFEGHVECVKLIAAVKNADIHCVDKEGRTVLMVAAAMGRLKVCEVLIELGINVNHKDTSLLEHTALTLAAEAGHCDVVRLLCNNKADYNYKLTDGRSALDMARGRSRRSVVDALHIIQLTEAAKKTDKGLRLSSTNSTNTLTESATKLSTDNVFFPSNEVKAKEETEQNSKTPAALQNTVLSLYNDSKSSNLYDRDVSMYDSKSTLASLSSLDVSIEPVNKSYNYDMQNKVEPPPKNFSIELLQKESEIKMLKAEKENEISHFRAEKDSQINQMRAAKDREIKHLKDQIIEMRSFIKDLEFVKTSLTKSETKVKDLEKRNIMISNDKKNIEVANTDLKRSIANLQMNFNKNEDKLKKMEEVVKENENERKENALEINNLKLYNEHICDNYQNEEEKNDQQLQYLNKVLAELGLTCDKDFQCNMEALKQVILQLRKKEKETGQGKKIEIEKLQKTTILQATSLEDAKSKLLDCEEDLKKQKEENKKLKNQVKDLQETIKGNDVISKTQSSSINKLEEDLKSLQTQLAGKAGDVSFIEDLQHQLKYQKEIYDEQKNEIEESKRSLETLEANYISELETLNWEKNSAKKEAVENEKTISELRVQRNQREAKISALEKSFENDKIKLKELEVESNRARQEVTEAKQHCTKLQEEIVVLRKSRKELTSKLSLAKLQETKIDKGKIDSISSQLEHVYKHLQESEKKYNETIAVYRNHLLKAAKGELDPEVLLALKEIIKNQEQPNSSQPSS